MLQVSSLLIDCDKKRCHLSAPAWRRPRLLSSRNEVNSTFSTPQRIFSPSIHKRANGSLLKNRRSASGPGQVPSGSQSWHGGKKAANPVNRFGQANRLVHAATSTDQNVWRRGRGHALSGHRKRLFHPFQS